MTHKAYLQDSYEDALRKNLELQAQLAAWQELGARLVECFTLDEDGKVLNFWQDMDSDALIKRLLELTSD